ncbi:MAG: hypothetical protein GY941_03070 [Planctomycetes bacterium]|nr:hypothetical protein [Planctomycetota bacterium]
MHKKGKSVRKCHGCILNLGDHCAVYEDPHERWHHSKCSSHNDQKLYNEYIDNQKKHSGNQAKEQRQENAKRVQTNEHHQRRKIG